MQHVHSATWSNTKESNTKQIIKHRAIWTTSTHLCRTMQSDTTYQQMSDWWHRLEVSPPGHRLLLVIASLFWSLWLVLDWEYSQPGDSCWIIMQWIGTYCKLWLLGACAYMYNSGNMEGYTLKSEVHLITRIYGILHRDTELIFFNP